MVHACCVYKCNNRATKDSPLHFHSFPSRISDKDRFDQWIRAVNRQTESGSLWMPSPDGHDKICSQHFVDSDYKEDTKIKILKKTAVPSVFPEHPIHTQKPVRTPRPPPRKRNHPSGSESESPAPKVCIQDHPYTFASPEDHVKKLKDKIEYLEQKLKECKAENKCLKEKLKRRDKKCTNLRDSLIEATSLTNEKTDILDLNFDQDALALIENELRSKETSSNNHRYSETVKKFAVTVNFYSPQAYRYLRKTFHLPNPSTIRRWASSVKCEPGFLSEVLVKLSEDLKNDERMRDVCMMFDAVAIRKEIAFDTKTGSFAGCVDFGTFFQGNSDDVATEALFFMVAGIQGHWKRPFGYFLGKADGYMQAQLVNHAVSLLYENGFNVVSVTCDGSFVNQATAKALGCHFDSDVIQSSFPHPEDNDKSVFFVFDACHLLKSVRNCLGDLKHIKFMDQDIKWCYVQELHRVQMSDDLHLANKLNIKHIDYFKSKMNVRIAAQTLSNSVADAIDFLRENQKHPDFRNSEATTTFIRNIDTLFDLCNSRNPVARGSKSKIDINNLQNKIDSFRKLADYLKQLTDVSGRPLVTGRRKTPFLGFLVTINSITKICEMMLSRQQNPLKFVLTYKMSQDHLEMFFSRLRRRGGWNNNPNALQLKWSLRALLIHNDVSPSSYANCIEPSDPDNTIFMSSPNKSNPLCEQFAQLIATPSSYHENALFYVAGFICRKMARQSKCTTCAVALFTFASETPDLESMDCSALLRQKDRGGLLASNDMYKIIAVADRLLKAELLSSENAIKRVSNSLMFKLQSRVYGEVRSSVFCGLTSHFMESHSMEEDDHGAQMIKTAVFIYTRMIAKHHAKIITQRFVNAGKTSVRHLLNKKILFLNQ